ncbi:MAG: NFACT family protein [Deltaproteobacteria bacterium]|nr:NFACT family protein [Deltaproteobacteria bacterium]
MGRTATIDEISLVVAELDGHLRGAIVQDARQPRPLDIYIDLRLPGETVVVVVSADGSFSRIHATTRRPPNPAVPFSFQSLLRARLCGERLESARQLARDRVVELKFTSALSIAAELTGRHANVFLCETGAAGENVIAGSIRPNLSQRRALVPGRPYVPPAPLATHDSRPTTHNPRLAPHASRLTPDAGPLPFNLRLDDEYASVIGTEELEWARAAARAAVQKEIRRLDRLRENVSRDLAAAVGSGEYTRFGEALKLNLGAIRRGVPEAVLTEYTAEGPGEIRVPLKPDLGPRENMERYFRLSRRLSTARDKIATRLTETEKRAVRLAAAGQDLERCEKVHEVHNVLSRVGLKTPPAGRPSGRSAQSQAERLPYREYFIEGAGRFLVGRGAADNDTLTFRVARGSDLWFHTVGFPGSHVVAPLPRDREPSAAMIVSGARLAASRSHAPEGEKVEVAYTRQKYLRTPRGAKPGTVIVTREKRILVTVEKGAYSDCAGGSEET